MNMNKSDRLLETHLRELRLPTFLENYQTFASDAAQNNLDYARFLLALAEQEVARRQKNRIGRCITNAHFPVQKELADFDFSALPGFNKARLLDLARGEYIQNKEPVIFLGNPGLGKTHLATALGMAACHQGRKVRFFTAARLVNELTLAQSEQRLHKLTANLLRLDLLILDELGFIPLTPNGAQLIFTLVSELHERVAMIVTTNLKFADWTTVFLDEVLTAALLDRLTYKAHILELIGESFRFKKQLEREQKKA
jgi:DNA replication protein DnaC